MKDPKFSEKREEKIGKLRRQKKVDNKNFKCEEQCLGFPCAGGAYGNWHKVELAYAIA